jgi:hypothetical protein
MPAQGQTVSYTRSGLAETRLPVVGQSWRFGVPQTIDKLAAEMAERAAESGMPQFAQLELGTFGLNARKFTVFVTVAEIRKPKVEVIHGKLN